MSGSRVRRALKPYRVLLLTSLVVTITLLVLGGPAAAHAVLVAVSPPDGVDLPEAPDHVQLTFNEPVQVAADGLRVFDANAARVDTGLAEVDDPEHVVAGLPDDLPDGGYVVTYRVLSADSHPVAGVTTFTVGGAAAVDETVVAELFGGAGTTAAGTVGPLLRGLGYVATLLAAGAVGIASVVARHREHRERARVLATRAAVAGIVLTLLAVPVQAAASAGIGILDAATSARALADVLGSGFGEGSLIRATALLVLAVLWRKPTPALLVGLAAGAALGSYLRDGHQRTVEPSWAMIGGDALHLGAGALWLAGLVLLILVLRAPPADQDVLPGADLVARFSNMALYSVLLLAVSGTAMAWPLVGTFGALTSTTYGWMLLAKVSAVAAVLVIALYNRQRLVPAIVEQAVPRGGSGGAPTEVDANMSSARFATAWTALTTTVRLEAVVLVGVLLLTGFLASQQPAAEEAGLRGIYETTAPLGDDLEIDVIVDPNRVGRNALHLYVVDATGLPSGEVDDLTVELTYLPEGIGPIPVDLFSAGPGHWTANTDDLIFAGNWELRVVAGIDRFTELTTEVVIPVAG